MDDAQPGGSPPMTMGSSGPTQPESDAENDHDLSRGESSDGDNGDRPRKRQKRPMSVSTAPNADLTGAARGGASNSEEFPGTNWLTLFRRCELCKQRKVKCDRGQPSCGWCTRNGALCEYKERKKPGLRAGYGRELEQRLDRLEEILQTHSRILETGYPRAPPSIQSDQSHTTPSQDAPSLFRAPGETNGHVARAETALFLGKPSGFTSSTPAMDYASSLPPATPRLPHDVFQQPMPINGMQTGAASIHNNVQSDFYSNANPPLESPSLNINTQHNDVGLSTDQDLPPYDLLYALADLYFKHINTWCPILHRRSTLDSLFGPSTLEEADRILLHAIVATTLRFSHDTRLTEEKRQHYHDVSKQKVLLYGLENSSVKSLQALVILALDLVGSGNGPPGWNLLALITRSVVQLGLAVETNSFSVSPNYPSIYTLRAMVLPDAKNWIEEESRRRLFWMIYLLDRYATIATAFDFALNEKEIDRKLPCRVDFWNKNQPVETRWFRASMHPEADQDKPENLGTFSYYIEILGILSKIHKFLKKPVDIGALSDVEQWQGEYRELDNVLTSWKFALPGEYGNMAKLFQPANKSINVGWVMLHATYHTAMIRLHSSAAYPTTRSPIFTPSYSASQRCHGAVENIAALCEWTVQNNMLSKLGPPFAFTLWVAARLLLVHGSTVEHKVSPQIELFVETLRGLGRYWQVAERYSSILQRVLDEHRESERTMGTTGERVTPSSVRILADMRRCAYDLDFLISRQPHTMGGVSRLPSATPARTPAPNELEYLDVFDFFNVPRLAIGTLGESMNGTPQNGATNVNGNGNQNGAGVNGNSGDDPQSARTAGANDMPGVSELTNAGGINSEFNITNYMIDANSDWLFKDQGQGSL